MRRRYRWEMGRKDTTQILFTTPESFKSLFPAEDTFAKWLSENGFSACTYTGSKDPDIITISERHLLHTVHTIIHELVEREIWYIFLRLGIRPNKHGIVAPIQSTVATHIMSQYKDGMWGSWRLWGEKK